MIRENEGLNFDSETEDRLAVEDFFYSLNGLEVTNHKGERFKLVLKRPNSKISEPEFTDHDQFLFEIDGYPGFKEPFSHVDPNANYFWFSVDYESKIIIPEYFLLTHPDLKSYNKIPGVTSSMFRAFGQTFPDGFRYYTVVANDRIKTEMLNVKKKVVKGNLSINEGEDLLRSNYWIQERLAAGFNINQIYFLQDQGVYIVSEKTNGNRVLKVDFDLFNTNVKGPN
jgi:hypothetical protein